MLRRFFFSFWGLWVALSFDAAAPGHAQSAGEASWTTAEGVVPNPRHEHCAVTFQERIYLIGGRGIAPVDQYDVANGTWSSKKAPAFDTEIHHMQCVVLGNSIVVGGAWTGPFPAETNFDDIYFYNPDKDLWTRQTTMPPQRSRGSTAAAVYDGKVYYVNGNVGGHREEAHALALFDSYDPVSDTWTELSDSPTPRDHMGAAVVESTLYVMGGRDSGVAEWDAVSAAVLTIDTYSFVNQVWTTLPEKLDIPLPGSVLTAASNFLVIAGGEIADANGERPALKDTRIYDVSLKRFWSDPPDMKVGRNGVALVACGTTVYAPTGSTSSARSDHDSMEVLNFGPRVPRVNCLAKALPSNPSAPPRPTRGPVSSVQPIESEAPDASGSPEAEPACFPAESVAEVRGLGRVSLENLRVGDEVLSDGGGEYSAIFGFSHRELAGTFKFTALTLESNLTVTLSAKHLLLTGTGSLVAADGVRRGDWLLNGQVETVETVHRRGLINPHTESGTIVVDGVQTSCYTDSVPYPVAQTLLVGPRILWKATGMDWLRPLHADNSTLRRLLDLGSLIR